MKTLLWLVILVALYWMLTRKRIIIITDRNRATLAVIVLFLVILVGVGIFLKLLLKFILFIVFLLAIIYVLGRRGNRRY